MSRLLPCIATVLLMATLAAAQTDYTQEDWNDPQLQENGWFYWNENNGQPPPDHHEPLNWQDTGGIGNTGHAYTDPMVLLTPHHDETRAYFPAYNMLSLTPPHHINLEVPNAAIQVSFAARVQPFTLLDFHGGVITPFVGYWDEATGRQAFYYNSHGIAANEIPNYFSGNPRWREFTFPCAPADWEELVVSTPPPPGVDDVTDLLHWPQQWGFTILDDNGPPVGVLAVDNFRVIPEPATLSLLALGGLAMLRRRRR